MAKKKADSPQPRKKRGNPFIDQDKADKQKALRKPWFEYFDADGNKIGDDGYVMTKTRTRMHRVFDGYIIYTIILVVAAVVCTVFSYFQGATLRDWNGVFVGGNQLGGYDMAALLRYEALYCLWSAILFAGASFPGFSWFYDRKSRFILNLMHGVIVVASILYFTAGLYFVGVIEPVSLVNLVYVAFTWMTMTAVDRERPTLKKAKVAKTVKHDAPKPRNEENAKTPNRNGAGK